MNVPLSKHAIIRICKLILNKPDTITYDDVDQVKLIFQEHIDVGMSPTAIKQKYNIEYSDFGMFLKKSLGVRLKTVKDAVNNYYTKTGKTRTTEKLRYKRDCQFKFNPYSCSTIPGYDLLLIHGLFHPTDNPNGVVRDHMVSLEYGWRNKIPPEVISHYTNCRYIHNIENIKKGANSCITIDQLYENIKCDAHVFVANESLFLPKSDTHKQKISETNSKYMNITNGVVNMRVLKESEIPEGFRRGLTKKFGRSARTRTEKRDILNIPGIPDSLH